MFRLAQFISTACVLICFGSAFRPSDECLFADEPLLVAQNPTPNQQVTGAPTIAADFVQAQPSVETGGAPVNEATSANPVRKASHEEAVTDAKRITDLQRALEADQQALQSIEADLAKPDSEYHQAEAEFKNLDAQLAKLKTALQNEQQGGHLGSENEIARLKTEIEKQQSRWKLSKSRFELAIQQRKTTQEKAATLKQKLQQERQTLDKLIGGPAANGPAEARPAEQATPAPTAPAANPSVAGTPAPTPAAVSPAPSPAAPAAAPTPTPAIPVSPLANGLASPTPAPVPAAEAPAADKPASKELVKAIQDAEKKQAVAQEAEKEVQSGVERMELLRKDIELELQLLATTRKKADNALETERQLQDEYEAKLRDGAPTPELAQLRLKLTQAKQRFSEARGEARERVNRIDELQARYATLQSEQIVVLQEAERTRSAAESAQKNVEALRNPFTVRNLLQWLIDHGPRLGVIFVTMLIGLWTIRVAKHRIIDIMVKRGGLVKRVERENRARTLVGVFENATTVAIVGGGALMILDTIGVPITTLMGGAAVFGLAIAFGAQSLIKDYFYGFMILLEQQYTINDVIKIGDIAGQVERITLRVTVLRDLEGRVHFIPHGTITSTTNMTHGWSRALFEIGVAYKEDADRVIELVKQLGQEMRTDAYYQPLILEDLTMLGVDAFNDSAVVIKFFIKTRPLKQWEVKRELLRRIKKAFDEQGIEIPFPHRTVYHRHVGEEHLESSVPGSHVDTSSLRKSA